MQADNAKSTTVLTQKDRNWISYRIATSSGGLKAFEYVEVVRQIQATQADKAKSTAVLTRKERNTKPRQDQCVVNTGFRPH